MVDKKKIRKILEILQDEVISLEVEPDKPDSPSMLKSCKVVKLYGQIVLLAKIVPVQLRETIGASEIPLTVVITKIRKIQIN